jgi:hypothetical protein
MGIWGSGPGAAVSNRSGGFKVEEFNGGVHVNLTKQSKAVPYVAGGVGIGRTSGSATATTTVTTRTATSTSTSTYTETVEGSGNHFRVNAGFGVKLYAGSRWGLQPEVKYYHYSGDAGSSGIRFTVGLFVDFGK